MTRSHIVALSVFTFMIFIFTVMMPGASASGANGLIFRANVSEIYIEGQPFPVQVQATFFEGGIPQTGSVQIYIQILNVTSSRSAFTSVYNVSSGIVQFIYISALGPGEYMFSGYASVQGQQSQQISLEFLVAPPPVPYSASFVSGGLFSFHSDVLNRTGAYRPSDTFTVNVYYQYPGGTAELVDSYTNVTNLTISFPDEGETVVVNIVDKYGWLNGMGINPPEGMFSGPPYTYDFSITSQQPFYSVYAQNFIPDVIAVFLMTVVVLLIASRIWRPRTR